MGSSCANPIQPRYSSNEACWPATTSYKQQQQHLQVQFCEKLWAESGEDSAYAEKTRVTLKFDTMKRRLGSNTNFPRLVGKEVTDEDIITYLGNFHDPKGPYVFQRVVSWTDRDRKREGHKSTLYMGKNATIDTCVRTLFEGTKAHVRMAIFQTTSDSPAIARWRRHNISEVGLTKETGNASAQIRPLSPKRTRSKGPLPEPTIEEMVHIKPVKKSQLGPKNDISLKQSGSDTPKLPCHMWAVALVKDHMSGWHALIFDVDAAPTAERNSTIPYPSDSVASKDHAYFQKQRRSDWLFTAQQELVKSLEKRRKDLTVWIGDGDDADNKGQGECVVHTTEWFTKIAFASNTPLNPNGIEDDERFSGFRAFGLK